MGVTQLGVKQTNQQTNKQTSNNNNNNNKKKKKKKKSSGCIRHHNEFKPDWMLNRKVLEGWGRVVSLVGFAYEELTL